MAHQWIMKLRFFLFFTFIKNAVSVCRISRSPDILEINGSYGPLIYKYKSDGTPVFHYPSADSNCIFQSEDPLLRLACPVPNSTMQFYQRVGSSVKPVNATSSSVYLLHDPSNSTSLRVHGGPRSFAIVSGHYIRCLKIPSPTMHLVNATNSAPTLESYAIGYRLNDVDLLKVYEQTFYTNAEIQVVHSRIKSVIENRPVFSDSNVYRRGVFYRNMGLNFTEIFSKEYQIASFQQHYKNLELTEKYFAGNNSLVVGQLIFKNDTFYFAEQISTRYYENTAPMWKSVYDGNWRTIGNIIRKIADETTRDLDVFVTVYPSFLNKYVGDKWALGNTTSSPDFLPVPEILVKAAVDVENHARGTVFYTLNDPHLNVTAVKPRNYCLKTTDCKVLHQEFDDVLKGYTFCCMPEDSFIFINILKEKMISN